MHGHVAHRRRNEYGRDFDRDGLRQRAQKKPAAQLVLEGDKPAICITEPEAGSDTTAMTTRADKRGDTYVVNGKKHWITGAGVSALHLIFARVFDEHGEELGIGGFLAVRGQQACIGKREQTMGLRGMPEGEIIFEDLEIPAAWPCCRLGVSPRFRRPDECLQ